MLRMGSTIRSAKMNEITPPKLIPPFQRTAASGTFPMEQTKERTDTSGPTSGPQSFARSGWWTRKNPSQKLFGTQAASATARIATIRTPPTNTASVNCQPSSNARITPSSITRFVEANSKAIAAVKFAPFRKMERARATAAYGQDDETAPRAHAIAKVLGESSGSSRLISALDTTAWTAAERANPSTRAHRISQVIPKARLRAWAIPPVIAAARLKPKSALSFREQVP